MKNNVKVRTAYFFNKFNCIFCFFAVLFFVQVLSAQTDFSKEAVVLRLKADMAVLTADSLQGRMSGTPYEIKARNYIASQFEEIGLKPIVGDTSYAQPFYVYSISRTCFNVCGLIDNGAAQTVVIGAHYDHVGLGYYGSRGERGHIHYGADDNASGVVAIIELARYLKEQKDLKYNYLFVAFSAEELGLHGSEHFVKSKLYENYNVAYMLNFDMVGRYNFDNKKRLIVFGTGSSKAWKGVLKKQKNTPFKIKKVNYGPHFSDHAAFYKNNISLLYFTTGIHKEYHTPLDTYELINFDGMAHIVFFVNALIKDIENAKEITFKKSRSFQIIRSYAFSASMML